MTPEAREALLDLAARCEAYTPSGHYDLDREWRRETNERIAIAIGLPLTQRLGHAALGTERTVPTRISDYVTSLDAAMGLVPEGHGWRLWVPDKRQERDDDKPRVTMWGSQRSYAPNDVEAVTPALALAASALRARAATPVADAAEGGGE